MIWRVATLCLVTVCLSLPSVAQSQAEIALKVERLEREMIALENRLRGGGPAATAPTAAGQLGDRALLADIAAKIGTVERQMRTLTGRLEEIEFKQRQLDDALDLLRRELELQRTETAQAMAQAQTSAGQPATESGVTQSPRADVPAQTEPLEEPKPEIELPEGDAAAQYQYAFAFIQKNDLDNGYTAMEKFLTAHPDDTRAGNAKFWLGRIHLLKRRMPQAAQQLLTLIEEHPNHPKRVDALVDLADVLIALDSAPDACNALAEFRRSDDKASDRLKARAARTAEQASCSF